MLNKYKNSQGYSIIEALIAMSIFITVVTVAINAFASALNAQKVVIAEETMSQNISFAMEFMNRQLRTATPAAIAGCGSLGVGDTFVINPPRITFFNDDGNCVQFMRSGQKMVYVPDATASPVENIDLISNPRISVDNFYISAQGGDELDGQQPRVTLTIEASWDDPNPKAPNVDFILQTTVSTRLLDS